jgi:hypothetical protein
MIQTTAYILAGFAVGFWIWVIWYVCKRHPRKSVIVYNDDERVYQLWVGNEVVYEHTFYSRVLEEQERMGV